jgi:GMP synthase (glutamine-hydrolysing)
VVEDAGHRFEEWSLAWSTPPPRPIDDYGAIFVFGGSMHADQDDRHPWLREENLFIQRLLNQHVPMFGVCLGIQLIAKAQGCSVHPLEGGPEIGWISVETTAAADGDPVFGALPERFDAFGWHYYTYDVPCGAAETIVGPRCNQAYRLGDAAWGIQFHAEVTLETVRSWLDDEEEFPLDLDADELWAESQERMAAWNEIGRTLCGSFLEVAERSAIAV